MNELERPTRVEYGAFVALAWLGFATSVFFVVIGLVGAWQLKSPWPVLIAVAGGLLFWRWWHLRQLVLAARRSRR